MRGRALVAMGALLVLACGSEPERRPTGRSMAAPAAAPGAADNEAPQVSAVRFDPLSPRVDASTRAVVRASDPDGDPVQLRYEWRVNGGPVVSTDAAIETTGLAKGDQLEVTVVATDGRAESERFVRAVAIGNRPPIVSFVGIVPESPSPGVVLEAEVAAVDEDGDELELRYVWRVNGRLASEDGSRLDTEALAPGDIVQLEVAASDGSRVTRPTSSAPVRIGRSRAPEIVSQPGGLREDGVFRYALEAVDPEGDAPLRFELLESPAGMTLDASTGELAWTPGPEQSGTFTVDVKVVDPWGAASAQRFDLSVRRDAPPASPR